MQDDYAVEWDDDITCIEDGRAFFVVTLMDRIDDPSKAIVVSTYANFALNLFTRSLLGAKQEPLAEDDRN